MAEQKQQDTSDAMLALHLNEVCDGSCAYCTIDRAAEILAGSKRRATDNTPVECVNCGKLVRPSDCHWPCNSFEKADRVAWREQQRAAVSRSTERNDG